MTAARRPPVGREDVPDGDDTDHARQRAGPVARRARDRREPGRAVNPGATDTGWTAPDVQAIVRSGDLQPRLGLPADAAELVSSLLAAGRLDQPSGAGHDGGRP